MKQFIVNTLYWMGDIISRTYVFNQFGWGYNTYSKLMQKSLKLQEKWNLPEPWQEPEN